jgi:hypothetical protein
MAVDGPWKRRVSGNGGRCGRCRRSSSVPATAIITRHIAGGDPGTMACGTELMVIEGIRSIRHVEMVMQRWDRSLTGHGIGAGIANRTWGPEEERIHGYLCNRCDLWDGRRTNDEGPGKAETQNTCSVVTGCGTIYYTCLTSRERGGGAAAFTTLPVACC